MLIALLVAVLTTGSDGFVSGKHCLTSSFATGDLIPIPAAKSSSARAITVTSIALLQTASGAVAGFLYADPDSQTQFLEPTAAMTQSDMRLSGYRGPLDTTQWLQTMRADASPWSDLTVAACASGLPQSTTNYDRDAAVTRAVEPDYPDISRQQGATGTVTVAVFLDAQGQPKSMRVQKSSGNAALDYAALTAAWRSSYSAAIVKGKAVASVCLFNAVFNGQ